MRIETKIIPTRASCTNTMSKREAFANKCDIIYNFGFTLPFFVSMWSNTMTAIYVNTTIDNIYKGARCIKDKRVALTNIRIFYRCLVTVMVSNCFFSILSSYTTNCLFVNQL